MEPTPKHPDIEKFLENIGGRSFAIKANMCIGRPLGCGKPVNGFTNDISRKEYTISGLCQACQDNIFGKGV